jgi:hypothetical protein
MVFLTMIKDRLEARRIIKELYKDVWAYTVPRTDDLTVRKASGSSLYGEITFRSVEKLIHYLRLKESDVFFDLGSGVGKVVMQIGMTTKVKKAVGVELSETRFKSAKKALAVATKSGWILPRKIQFRNENILETDLSKATVVYTCSTAFPMTLMRRLAKTLAHQTQPLRIVSLQKLPETKGLYLIDKLPLDMSWARQTPVHIYSTSPG